MAIENIFSFHQNATPKSSILKPTHKLIPQLRITKVNDLTATRGENLHFRNSWYDGRARRHVRFPFLRRSSLTRYNYSVTWKHLTTIGHEATKSISNKRKPIHVRSCNFSSFNEFSQCQHSPISLKQKVAVIINIKYTSTLKTLWVHRWVFIAN